MSTTENSEKEFDKLAAKDAQRQEQLLSEGKLKLYSQNEFEQKLLRKGFNQRNSKYWRGQGKNSFSDKRRS